jgi:hypothetical protein
MTAVKQQWDDQPPKNSRRPCDEDAHAAHDKPQLREPRRTHARKRVGLRNFASSESLPGVCPNPPRQGALDAEHV